MLHPRSLFITLIALALFALALVYLQTGTFLPLNIYDEGIIAFGAVRVMDGQVPYRDFWTQYSPGQLYVLAGLFQAFGKTIMVEREMDIVIRAALALMIFVLGARLATTKTAAVLWVLALLWVQYYGFFGYPIFTGLLFSLACIFAFLQGLTNSSWRWMFVAGLLLGVEAVFRHDMAVYTCAAQIIVFVVFAFARMMPSTEPLARRFTQAFRTLLPYIVGALVVLVPVLAVFLSRVPAGEMLQQLFIFPLTVFPKVRDLPYPKFDWTTENLPFYAPFLIYVLVIGTAVLRMRAERNLPDHDSHRAWGMLMVALFGLFGFNQARVRSDTIHTVQFFLPALLLLPALVRGISQTTRWSTFITRTVGVVLMIACVVNPIDSYVRQRNERATVADTLNNTLPVARGALIDPGQNFAVRFVQDHTKPGDMVYIGLSRHDRVFANDAMFYFLMERRSATRYHELHPGLTNTAPVQQEMIDDLERNHVQYVVLTNMFEGAREPNDSALTTDVTLLDKYIKKHYRFANTIGSYTILKRRD